MDVPQSPKGKAYMSPAFHCSQVHSETASCISDRIYRITQIYHCEMPSLFLRGEDHFTDITTLLGIQMNKERHLEIIEDRKQEIEMIESLIRKEDSHNEPVRILEAGCGRRWPFKMEGIQHILTGLDMDKAALEIRKNTLGDLHETVEGDLCSVDLGANRYDVIYCSFVLEHVKRADVVMKNFVKWIKPNGIIIIKIPDPYSVQGYITRITPYWFHVFYYRFILGHKTAGKPGYAPSLL